MRNNSIFETIYSISVVLAMGLLFYANADVIEAPDGTVAHLGIGKAFYVPCGIALVSSFFIRKKKDWLDKVLTVLVFTAILSSLIHPPISGKFLSWTVTRFILAILCFKDIRNVDSVFFAKAVSIAAPLIVFPHYILSNPFSYGDYRYGGFYGDPNFLALALNFIIALCYITFRREKRIIIRICCISSIIGAIPLILLGMSRGGVLGLFILIASMVYYIYKKKRSNIMIMIILLVFMGVFFSNKMGSTISRVEDRFFGDSTSDKVGAMARLDGIESVLNVFNNKPELIPFGIGLGNTYNTIGMYREYGYFSRFVVHNTYFSLLYELGLIGLVLYLLIYVYAFKNLYQRRDYLMIGILLSAIISLSTLPGAAFMPGWILLFYVSNKSFGALQYAD